MVRRLWLLLLVAAALPAFAGASTQATREVRITDAAVTPFQLNIAVDDSARWRNQGRRSHTVVSDSGAWTPFTLRPGRTKTIRFREAGCYNYKVDGRIRGRIAVAASCAPGGGGGNQPPGPRIHTYDITVTGRAHTNQRHSGDEPGIYNNNGTVDVAVTWKSTFKSVALKKLSTTADSFIMTNATGSLARGTTDLTFTYDHAREPDEGPCRGSFTLESLASRVRVHGFRGPGLGNDFSVGSIMTLASSKTFLRRIDSACPRYSDEPRWIEFQGSPEPDIVRGGLTWRDVDPLTTLTVTAERKSSRMFFPLDRLRDGDGFTIQTGPIRNQGRCHFGTLARVCTETFVGNLTVKFVKRPR